jgi:hypothetical protein
VRAGSDARMDETLVLIAEGRDALERSRARLDRSEVTLLASTHRVDREQAEIDRETARSARDLHHGEGDGGSPAPDRPEDDGRGLR